MDGGAEKKTEEEGKEDDIKLCKENVKEFLNIFATKKANFSHILEKKSLAANSLLKGTCNRAFKRMADQKIVVDGAKNVVEISDKNSLFKYEAPIQVGSRKFIMRFRNNEKSHKIECLWLGKPGEKIPEDGEEKSSLMMLFKEGYRPENSDIEFQLPVRRNKAYAKSSKAGRLTFGDEHLLTINMGKPLPEIPRDKFDVQLRHRYHRDKAWVVLFFIYWIVEIGMAIHAFANGRPARVLYGIDSLGNLCGEKSDIIDLSTKTHLFYAAPEETNGLKLCVANCPSTNDTVIENYIFNLLNHGNSTSGGATIRSNMPTVVLANRCLPTGSGSTTVLSVSATLFADAVNGWKSTFVTCIAAFLLGFIWMKLMLSKPTFVLNFAFTIAILGLLLFTGVFLVSYAIVTPPAGMDNSTSYLVDPGVQTLVLVFSLISFCFLLYIIYKSCRLRKDFGNASKVFDLTSEALRDCNIAIIHANCCIPTKQNLTEKTGDGEGKIADASDVEIENGEEAKDTNEEGVAPKPKAINIRPILTFPIYNFIILVSFIVLWMLVFLHLISLGNIEQVCECIKSLDNCMCSRYFEFDTGARWFAIVHLYGLFWGVSLIVNVTRVTISMTVSTWYFSEAKDLEVRTLPPEIVRSSYRRTLWHHSGSLLKASFYTPVVVILRPLSFFLLQIRDMFSCVGRITFCCRGCIRVILLSCCGFQQLAYLDIRAAMQQIALHGSSFIRGATVGTKLKMRNEDRVKGLENALSFKLLFGKLSIFCFSFFIGWLYFRAIDQTAVGSIGAPIIVLVLNSIVAFATMSLFVEQYDMSIETILQDFFEDCERNMRSTEVFMPPEFRKFIDDYGYYTSGTFPSDPTAMYRKLFNANKLGVMHVATKEVLCQYVTTYDAQLNDKTKYPEEKEGYYIKGNIPLKHESQPRNSLDIYHFKYGRLVADNINALFRIPFTAKSLVGEDESWTKGLKKIQWDQIKLPIRGGGYHKLRKLDPSMVAKRAPNDPHLNLIKSGEIICYHSDIERGLAEQDSEQQCLDNGSTSIRILVNMRTLRVARRLIDAEEDSSVAIATPAPLSGEEKAKYLEDNGFDNAAFKKWCEENELCMKKVPKYEKLKHPELSFAKDAFIFLHQTYYFYDSARSWVPVKPVDVIKGDIGSSGTINNLYVAILRYNGIVARCLSGAWLWSNDGTYTAEGVQRGATEGEMLALDMQRRTMSEFYLPKVGWIPTDATPTRLSYNFDPTVRRARARMGKYGWNKNLSMTCLANFGNDSGLLLLNSAGFEMGRPKVQIGPVGNDMGKYSESYHTGNSNRPDFKDGKGISLNNREFMCTDLAVSSYQPEKGMKDDLFNAIETLTPVDPNPEYGKVKTADQG